MPKIIDPEEQRKLDEAILSRYAEGKSYKQIAEEIGRKPCHVLHALERHREFYEAHKRLRCRRSHLPADKVSELLKNGNSYGAVAAIMGVSYATIARLARDLGLNRMARKPKTPRKERKPRVRAVDRVTPEQCETIVEMAGRAETYRAISEATGIGRRVINEVLKREGLWPKPCRFEQDDCDPPWWPDPNDPLPDYGDDFVLKPEHRARLEEVRYRRRIGRPIVQRQYKTERTRHD